MDKGLSVYLNMASRSANGSFDLAAGCCCWGLGDAVADLLAGVKAGMSIREGVTVPLPVEPVDAGGAPVLDVGSCSAPQLAGPLLEPDGESLDPNRSAASPAAAGAVLLVLGLEDASDDADDRDGAYDPAVFRRAVVLAFLLGAVASAAFIGASALVDYLDRAFA